MVRNLSRVHQTQNMFEIKKKIVLGQFVQHKQFGPVRSVHSKFFKKLLFANDRISHALCSEFGDPCWWKIQKSFGVIWNYIYGAWYRWQCLEQVLYWISNLYLFKIVPNSIGTKHLESFHLFYFRKIHDFNFLDFWRKRRFLEFIRFYTVWIMLFLISLTSF